MLAQFQTAAATARTIPMLDEIARLMWRAMAEGQLSETDAAAAGAAVEARRAVLRSPYVKPAPSKPAAARRVPTSPHRVASLQRKRRVASSGCLPPSLAAHFTIGELAALSMVAGLARQYGICDAPIDKIAAMAGVSRSTVKNALRLARRMGLLTVKERRHRGQKSDTNIVQIISGEWLTWLRLKGGTRGQKADHHVDSITYSMKNWGRLRSGAEAGGSLGYIGDSSSHTSQRNQHECNLAVRKRSRKQATG